MNINSIHGGESEGYDGLPAAIVADSCRTIIDRRFLIEESLEEVKGEVHALIDALARERPGFSCDIRDLWEVVPTMAPEDAPVVTAVSAAIEDILGRAAEHVVSPGTYDQKHIDRIGRLDNCIAYGPGILTLAHQPDEYVEVQDMIDAAKVMANAMHHLLHGRQACAWPTQLP